MSQPIGHYASGVPTTGAAQRGPEYVRDYVLERMGVAEKCDRPFKEAALEHWRLLNNILPEDWPFYSRFFSPETQIAHNDTVEGIMGAVFSKDTTFDLEPVEEQDEVQTEICREYMRFMSRPWYKLIKYFQCQEATGFGNGVEKHIVKAIRGAQGVEFWPTSKIVSRFDCYPAPTGGTIQDMPYFIERMILPLHVIKAIGRAAGYQNVEKMEAFLTVDRREGSARGGWGEEHFDLWERLAAVGYDIRSGAVEEGGTHAVQYAELLIYSEANTFGTACERIVILGNRDFVLRDGPNPFLHGRKPYSEIKFQPRAENIWQAKGIPELIRPVQEVINARENAISDILEHIKNPMQLVGMAAGIDDLSKLEPWPGARIRVRDINAIREMERPSVDGALWLDLQNKRAMSQRAGGTPDYAKGIAGNTTGLSRSTETATGMSNLINAANQAKTFKWLLAEEQGVSEGLQLTLQNVQQSLTAPQRIRILGENRVLKQFGVERVLLVYPDDIRGRWNIFAVGASRSHDSAQRAEIMSNTLQAWAQVPDPQFQRRIKWEDAAVEVAEDSGWRNPRRFLKSDEELAAELEKNGDPAQAQMQQMIALKLIESLDYKDAPPDVQRQLEQLAGLQPSQMQTIDPNLVQVAKLLSSLSGPSRMGFNGRPARQLQAQGA